MMRVSATVEDNGKGFDLDPVMAEEGAAHGIRMNQNRIEQVGGNFEIESQPGEGTRVSFGVPVDED